MMRQMFSSGFPAKFADTLFQLGAFADPGELFA